MKYIDDECLVLLFEIDQGLGYSIVDDDDDHTLRNEIAGWFSLVDWLVCWFARSFVHWLVIDADIDRQICR